MSISWLAGISIGKLVAKIAEKKPTFKDIWEGVKSIPKEIDKFEERVVGPGGCDAKLDQLADKLEPKVAEAKSKVQAKTKELLGKAEQLAKDKVPVVKAKAQEINSKVQEYSKSLYSKTKEQAKVAQEAVRAKLAKTTKQGE